MLYDIMLKTSIGNRNGTLELTETHGELIGTLDILGFQTKCTGRIYDGVVCCLAGSLKTFMNENPFLATGRLDSTGICLNVTVQNEIYSIQGIIKEVNQ
ncbi:MAG: hypothetical protein ACI4I5_06830 [Acutalibacteraceae bacterium]